MSGARPSRDDRLVGPHSGQTTRVHSWLRPRSPLCFQASRDETRGIAIGSVQFGEVHDMVPSTVYLSGRAPEGVDHGVPGTDRLAEVLNERLQTRIGPIRRASKVMTGVSSRLGKVPSR